MRLSDFYKIYMQNGLIPYIPAYANYPCLADYFEHQQEYDAKAISDWGRYTMCDDDPVYIGLIINATVRQLGAYKWPKLLETTVLEYNPLWNVDGTEVTEYGVVKNTKNIGQRQTTNTIGQKVSSVTNGARSTTFNNGERTIVVDNGDKNTTDSHYVVPFDATSESETAKDVRTETAVTDTTTQSESIDVTSDSAYTNTNTEGEHTDTQTTDAVEDTDTTDKHTDTLTRQGNIGVTSTQNLIGQERAIVNFNFYAIVLEDICRAITIPYFDTTEEVSINGSILV